MHPKEYDVEAATISAEQEALVSGPVGASDAVSDVIAARPEATETDGLIGSRLGPYRLLEALGRGASASVYRAQADGGREVALKLVRATGDQRRHFEEVVNEAMASSAVHHPHVVSCLSYGSEGQHLYIVMELAEAGDTYQLVRGGGPLDHRRILSLADQCARGLEAIHAAGLIHRDIKPSNIMLDAQGDARIGDLGLVFPAALAGDSMPAAGTPAYMSPEQGRGEALDARTDLYSLGATMYFWATGQPPFKGPSPLQTIGLVVAGETPDPRLLAPALPIEVVDLIRMAMEPRRERRFASAAHLRDAIAMVAAGGRPVAIIREEPVPEQPIAPRASAWRLPVTLGSAALLAVVGFNALFPADRERSPPPSALVPASPAAGIVSYAEHRVSWVGDPRLTFIEHGEVRYARAGRQVILARATSLACLDGSAVLGPLIASPEGFSVELTFQVDDLEQQGPARILACGLNHRLVNLMIGQSGTRLEVRCRTTMTNTDGSRPHLVTAEGSLTAGAHHLVFVRQGEEHALWLDGQELASVTVPGSLATWDASLPIAIGDEARGGFPWTGRIDQLGFITSPLGAEAIGRRFAKWSAERQP